MRGARSGSSAHGGVILRMPASEARDVRNLIAAICRSANLEVLEAGSIEDASVMIRLSPNLITLDNKLSDGSGMELVSLLRADPATASIPVLAISGSCFKEQALDSGRNDYIGKPFSADKLIRTM